MAKQQRENISQPAVDRTPPKPVSEYQKFAPAGAGEFRTNLSPNVSPEIIAKYQTGQFIIVDITECARDAGMQIGPTLAVYDIK